MSMSCGAALQAFYEQRDMWKKLAGDEKTAAPFLAQLMGTFGSSLHESVTPYFYIKIGASMSDIGMLNSIILASGVIAVT